jgi:hypothetical protein
MDTSRSSALIRSLAPPSPGTQADPAGAARRRHDRGGHGGLAGRLASIRLIERA